jgi:hypothetical protein
MCNLTEGNSCIFNEISSIANLDPIVWWEYILITFCWLCNDLRHYPMMTHSQICFKHTSSTTSAVQSLSSLRIAKGSYMYINTQSIVLWFSLKLATAHCGQRTSHLVQPTAHCGQRRQNVDRKRHTVISQRHTVGSEWQNIPSEESPTSPWRREQEFWPLCNGSSTVAKCRKTTLCGIYGDICSRVGIVANYSSFGFCLAENWFGESSMNLGLCSVTRSHESGVKRVVMKGHAGTTPWETPSEQRFLQWDFCWRRASGCRIQTAALPPRPFINRRQVINSPLVSCWQVPVHWSWDYSSSVKFTFHCTVPLTRAINNAVNEESFLWDVRPCRLAEFYQRINHSN